MNWLYYLAEANIYLSVFYLIHCLLMRKDTHYQLKRIYLVFSCIVSFILPVLQIGALKPVRHVQTDEHLTYTTPPVQAIIQRPAVPFRDVAVVTKAIPVTEHKYTFEDIVWHI